MNAFANNLNNDLTKINDSAIYWKISFNPNPSKQAREVFFSRKRQNINHDSICYNHNLVEQVPSQKLLRMHLDTKLNFQEHLDNIISNVIGLLRKLQAVLPRPSLVTIYKAFIRPYLDYGILYMTNNTKNHFIKN